MYTKPIFEFLLVSTSTLIVKIFLLTSRHKNDQSLPKPIAGKYMTISEFMYKIQNSYNCPPTHLIVTIGEDLWSIRKLESQSCGFYNKFNYVRNSVSRLVNVDQRDLTITGQLTSISCLI